jgi:HK97 family phage major capsid protein
MEENTKAIIDEIKQDLKKDLLPEVLKSLDEKLEKIGLDFKPKSQSEFEEKKKAAEYIAAVYKRDYERMKVLSPATAGEGAELVPTVLSSEILRVAGQYGYAGRLGRIFPVTNLKENLPTADGVAFYRKGPNGRITVSSVSTNYAVQVDLEEVVALVPFPNSFLENPTINVVDLIALLAGEAYAKGRDEWARDQIFSNATAYVLGSGKTFYTDITADDLAMAVESIDENLIGNLTWVMSFSVFNRLRLKKDSQNRYIVQEPGAGRPATLWDIPVVFSSVYPKTSEENQAGKPFIALGDFRYLVIATKGGMRMDISKEASVQVGATTYNLFQDNMSAVRFVGYEDINVALPTKSFVAIKTSAS